MLRDRYHFECKCLVCSNENWLNVSVVVNLSIDPLYKEGIKLSTMKWDEIRKLPREAVENFEKKAIEFLEKYDRFHPVVDTMRMQQALLRAWNILSVRY